MPALLRQLLILAVIFGLAAWALDRRESQRVVEEAARRAPPAPLVTVDLVRRAEIETSVSTIGTGKARRSVALRAGASGRIEEIAFRSGDRVERGQLLLRLDDAAERAALAEAEADLDEARAARERAEALRDRGGIADVALEAARAELRRAEARRDRAAADLRMRELRAPFDGVIGLTDAAVGALAGRDLEIAHLEDLSALRVEFSVPERHFNAVSIGDPIRATSSVLPDAPATGEVVAVERRVDEVTRTFRVRAEIPNPDLALPSGVFLRVSLVLEIHDGIAAPEAAVLFSGLGAHAFVLGPDDRLIRRELEIGKQFDGLVEIVSGLSEGEAVVVRGVQKVRDGTLVQVENPPPGAAPVAGAAPGDGAHAPAAPVAAPGASPATRSGARSGAQPSAGAPS